MFIDWKKVQLPEMAADAEPAKPAPVRPQGVSSRLPLLVLIALLAVGFIGYRSAIESAAWRAVEALFRQNQEVQAMIGEVRACRPWYPVKVDFAGESLYLGVTVRLQGSRGEGEGAVQLRYGLQGWEIVAAAIVDGQGRLRPLAMRKRPSVPPATRGPAVAPPAGR